MSCIARCLLQAVHYAHINHYVHQDIHLNNVFAALARDEMMVDQPKNSRNPFRPYILNRPKLGEPEGSPVSQLLSAKRT
jgi:hypothetical protein